MVLGTISSLVAFAESVRNTLNYSLQFYYQLVVLPYQISKFTFEEGSNTAKQMVVHQAHAKVIGGKQKSVPPLVTMMMYLQHWH